MIPKKSLRLKMMTCKFLTFVLVMALLPVTSIQVDGKEVVNSHAGSLDRLLVYEETDGQPGVLKAGEEQAPTGDSDENVNARSEDEVVIVFSSSSGGALTNKDVSDKLEAVWIDRNGVFAAELDESVTSIGDDAFEYCYNLTSVSIPDSVTSIGDYAFWHCEALTSIGIPDSVTSIGKSAFHFCSNLESIIIGKNVEYIGQDAFYGTQIETIKLPQSIIELEGPFSGMENLKNIEFESGITTIPAFSYGVLSTVINLYIPKSVKNIDGLSDQLHGYCTVFAFAESFAEKYAKENNMSFITLPTILPETDMPPDGYQYLPYSFKFKSSEGSWLEIVDGRLPDGLEISLVADGKRQLGEIYGAPLESGEFEVTVRATDGNVYLVEDDEVTFTINISDILPQTRLDEINEGRLQIPLGVYDDEEDIYVVDIVDNILLDMEIVFGCEYVDFIDLWIDGELQILDEDYSADEGSTIITLYSQTLGRLDSKTNHVIAGEFKSGGKADGEQYKVAQNFRINKIQGVDTGDNKVPDSGDGKAPDSGNNKAPDSGDNKVPDTGNNKAPDSGNNKAPDSGNNKAPDSGDNRAPDSGDNKAPDSGDNKAPDSGDNKVPDSGDNKVPDTGDNQVPDTGGGSIGVSGGASAEKHTEILTTEQPRQPIPEQVTEPLGKQNTFAEVFSDINETDWFFKDVEWAYEENIMTGVSQTSFAPYESVSPDIIFVTLARVLGVDLRTYDSDNSNWVSAAFAWAYDRGLFAGIDEQSHEMPFNRGRLAVALAKLTSDAGLVAPAAVGDEDITASKVVFMSAQEREESIENFIALDAELMSVEELDAFRLLYHLGILKGRGNGIMDPLNLPTRAELAAILHRLDKYAVELRNIFGTLSMA